MNQFSSIRDLIDAWPTRSALADDLGVKVDRVHKWARANRIPVDHLGAVLRAAHARGFEISADRLIDLHQPDLGRDAA